jgi:hypothetical protein
MSINSSAVLPRGDRRLRLHCRASRAARGACLGIGAAKIKVLLSDVQFFPRQLTKMASRIIHGSLLGAFHPDAVSGVVPVHLSPALAIRVVYRTAPDVVGAGRNGESRYHDDGRCGNHELIHVATSSGLVDRRTAA